MAMILPRVSRALLSVLAFLLPVWFLPYGGIDISRETTFAVMLSLAFIFWLVQGLLTGSLSYIKSPVNLAVGALVVVSAVSSVLSKVPYFSALASDAVGEKALSIVFYGIAYFLAISVLKEKKDSIPFALLLIAGGAVSALVSAFAFFGIYLLPFSFAKSLEFNVIGTVNSLSLLYGLLFILVTGFIFAMRSKAELMPFPLRIGLWVSWGLFLLNLVIINFQTAWVLLFASFLLMSWAYMRGQDMTSPRDGYFYLLIALLVLPILFMFIRVPVFSSIQIPLEVSPSFSASFDIAKKVWQGGIMDAAFGTGPGTFAYVYSLFHDQAMNYTNFWGIRFGQGYSFVATVLSTTGILGTLALVAVVLVSGVVVMKSTLVKMSSHPLFLGLVSGVLFSFLSWFLYPANYTLLLAAFFSLGFLVSITIPEKESIWGGEREISGGSAWGVFASSLVSVFLIALSLSVLYLSIGRFRAALALEDGISALQVTGNTDEAIAKISRAAELDSTNDRYFRFLAQARLLKVQGIINAAFGSNPSPTIQADFQREVSAAITALQESVKLNPLDTFNIRTEGSVYQSLVPFIPGSAQAAISAYTRAAQLDPVNPITYVEAGQTYLVIADSAQALAKQSGTTAAQAKEFNATRVSSLDSAAQAFNKAIELKPDLASAHFLLAQVALRQGKTDEAIRNTANAQRSAPQDIGILFQLGLLYYQDKQYTKAEQAFAQALVLNENYSNARYFLGLILDRRGEKEEAIAHFEKIALLNPDNQEVRQILSNLRAKKSALSGISSPESRNDAPVRERGGTETTPIKKK